MKHSSRVKIFLWAWLALSVVVPRWLAPAAAQAADADKLRAAQEAFDKAQSAYLGGNFDEAATGFEAAYAARPFSQFVYNIAASYHMKGKKQGDVAALEKAVAQYQRYLAAEPNAADRPKVEKTIGVLTTEITRLKTSPPTPSGAPEAAPSQEMQSLGDVKVRGLVVIESEPQGATIYMDDKGKGAFATTPWSGSLEGEHKIIIEKRGHKVGETRMAADPSKLLSIKMVLAEANYLGWVEISSNVPGADIFLDDKSVGAIGKTPYSANLKPGKHKVWIVAEGYKEFAQELDVAAGETAAIKAQLDGAPVGKLNVMGYGIEDSTISVDGKVLCARGPCLQSLPQGDHVVEVSRDGYKSYVRRISILPKTETSIKVALAPKPSRTDAVVAYVLAAGFAGGGVYLGLQSNKLRDELRKEIDAGTPPVHQDDQRFLYGKLYAIGADSMYAIAGISLLTAVYYTFRDKGAPSTGLIDVRATALTPVLSPSFAGLNMEVRW